MDRPPIPPNSERVDEIILAAEELLEDSDWEHVSTRMIADAVGIKAPSLYKHLRSRDHIAVHLATRALSDMGSQLHAISTQGGNSTELLARYRALAVAHPHRYRMMTGTNFPRKDLPRGLEEWAGTPFYLVAGRDPVRAQALWAFSHGMAILEIDARFAPEGSPAPGVWEFGATALSKPSSAAT